MSQVLTDTVTPVCTLNWFQVSERGFKTSCKQLEASLFSVGAAESDLQ